MMARNRFRALIAVALAAVLALSGSVLVRKAVFPPTTITALFDTATGIYPGDEVRIAGVKVGTITAIRPAGTHSSLTMAVDHGVPVPAEAAAVIVAQNLVSARFVQLAPAYDGGPTMADGAQIPLDRTAVPVEWDEVKTQLMRLATDLGPAAQSPTSPIGRLIDSAANAIGGNGDKLRDTLAELSRLSRTLANRSGNIVDTLANLQAIVKVLQDSNVQVVQFQDRLATLTGAVNGSRSDLDAALTNLSEAVGQVQRFVSGTTGQTSEQVQRLANVTQNLVDHRDDLEQVLHVAPSAIANAYNMFDPRTGGASGVFVMNNMADPVGFFCGMIGALENVTAPETAKLCAQYLGPGLATMNFNYLPFPLNPALTSVPSEDQLIYSDPKLRPEAPPGEPGPPIQPPAVSAYTGTTPTLPDLLLPAEGGTP